MALGDLQGHARTSSTNPEAKGLCDRCSFWYLLSRLSRQFEWAGSGLRDTGYLVCPNCLDQPFEQLRTLILPPDPVPKVNPRFDPAVTGQWPIGNTAGPTTPQNQGFTQYVLNSPALGDYPTTKADVLSQIATISGIPTPAVVTDRSVTLTQNLTVDIMAANPLRTWLLIYSPVVPPAAISKSTALWGAITNLMLGPGQAWFWANAQELSTVYKGVLTGIGLTPGMALYAWESNL